MKRISVALALAAIAGAPPAAQAQQQSLGAAANFHGYSFGDGLGIKSAYLIMVPVAYELPITRTLSVDLYSAFARGVVGVEGQSMSMTGIVDTRIRANWNATPWSIVTVGLNLPTGDSQHTGEEAVVANVLATEVLGFREASWGLGFGATTGLAAAFRLGETGIGLGASYRLASEFEPRADADLKYTPGNETRFRVALDRNFGTSKLTGGVTYQNYSKDKLDGRDLFQAGQRWRGDVALSFRAGPTSSWTLFAADIWREHGDVTQRFTDAQGNITRDTTFKTGRQNVLIAGVAGALRLASINVRPTADLRLLTREETGGEGWIAGFGSDFPMRVGSVDLFPSAKVLYGQLEGAASESYRALGGEFGINLRWGR